MRVGDDEDEDEDEDEDDDDDDDGDGSDAADENLDRLARMERYALYFDNFFTMVRCLRPWTEAEDTIEYREQRATELFNAGLRRPPASSTAQPLAFALIRGLPSQPRCVGKI